MMDEDWAVLTSFLPATWQELAVGTDAVKGLRKDKSPESLLRTLLIHLACGYSLRETAVRAREANLADMSDVALLKRLRKSSDWLHCLCVSLFKERGVLLGAQGGIQFRLFDATDVKEPGKTGSLWRIHYGVRVPSLACDFFKVTETKGQGTGESFSQFPVQAGDHIIADRGYCTAGGIHYVTSSGAFLCVRVNSQALPMKTSTGEEFELIPHLRTVTASGATAAWQVLIPGPNGSGAVAGRLCAIRKDKEAIRRTQKKLRRKASRKGQKLQPETLIAAEYVVVFTTFPETAFSTADVLEWYRVRWQVELVFKRFKQIARLGHLPKHDEASARAWLYGKLFVALLTEKVIAYATALSPWRSDSEPDPVEECMA
jgi:hypothetical protein